MIKVKMSDHELAAYLKKNNWDKTDMEHEDSYGFSNYLSGNKLLASVYFNNTKPSREIWLPEDYKGN